MTATINLDHQRCAVVGEVRDVASDRSLPPDAKVEFAQRVPQLLLTEGHRLSQTARSFRSARRVMIVVEWRRRFGDTGAIRRPTPKRSGRTTTQPSSIEEEGFGRLIHRGYGPHAAFLPC